ncbi:LysM peptidoglycan-binding domain-containing protein [Streptomyces sp. NPDC056144]|uniref:LysM peptidoglycan-binding domain-containing protein n=1 Tax=unclassified Streptomyces TaxID=2593676 RepID=UPI0035D75F92
MPAHRSLARRLPRALASLVALAAVTAGLPWLLAQATASLRDPGIEAFSHLLTRTDTGAAFLLTLTAVGWIAWATFMLSLLVEIPAQLRGRTAPRLPGLRLAQRAAGTLVSGILVLFASSALASAAPALANPVSAAPAVSAAAIPAPAPAYEHTAPATADDKTAEHSYTVRAVRPAESLWSIAEKIYGDGTLYTKIADANEGRTMVDGAVFHADAPIRPGWTLRLPGTPTTAQPAAHTYTVAPGDTLSQIAEDQLGDGDRYPELFEANQNKPQADGARLTNPDDLHTDWKLTLPTKTTPTTPLADTTAVPPSRPADAPPVQPPAADTPAPTPHTTPPPANPAPAPAAPPAKPHTDAPALSPSTVPAATDEESGSGLSETAGIGMLASGSLLVTLGAARMLQRRRRRKPGQLPHPVEGEAAEQALHAASDPGSLELLDRALRTFAHRAAQAPARLPVATGARITSHTVELLVPRPFLPDDEIDTLFPSEEAALEDGPFRCVAPGRWALDRTEDLLDPADAADVPAPYPGLVTLGTDPDGNHLLINLNVSRVLLLDGTPTAVRDTARVLALEAATSTWSDHAEIITVGLGDALPHLLPKNRMRAAPHITAARAELAELLLEQRQQAGTDDAPARMPWTLVCAADMEEDEARLLADTLTAARELPVALVLPAHGTAGAFGDFDDAVQITVGTTRPQFVEVLDADLIVQSLPEADYEAFTDLLRQADQPAQPAEEPWTQVPPIPVTVTHDGDTDLTAVPLTPFAAFTATRSRAPVPPPEQDAPEEPEADSADPASPDSTGPAAAPEPRPAPNEPAIAAAPDVDTTDPDNAVDLQAPEIQVLGPVAVTGIKASGHGPKLAQLAAYLHFKPGRRSDTVREAMDPRSPWGVPTLQTRISQLRNSLGSDSAGALYLPRDRSGTYTLSPKVRTDWDRFLHLAERGLRRGPSAGIPDLEAALALVRGVPFGGSPPAWAAVHHQEMLVRIIDTSHTLADWHRRTARPNLDAARRAIRLGLDVDDSAELLYQGWMRVEDQAGNREGVQRAYETLLTINRRLDVSTEPETEAIYAQITRRSA